MSLAAFVRELRTAGVPDKQIVDALLGMEEEKMAKGRASSAKYRKTLNNRHMSDMTHMTPPPSKEEIPPTPPKEETLPPLVSSLRSETLDAKRVEEAFEEAWEEYPKREGSNPKKPARLAFVRAVRRGATPEAIVAASRALAARYPERSPYIPQMVTWLNQDRFSDEEATGPPKIVQFETVEQIRERVRAERAKSAGSDTAGEAGFREAL